jgi:hypothetical protein
MVATARHETFSQSPTAGDPTPPAADAAARALARGYLRYVSALWRGERHAAAFAAWLDRFWCADLPPTPDRVPDAISPHGGGGHGIAWFGATDEVRGYVRGVSGGYRVPLAAIAGVVPPAAGREAPVGGDTLMVRQRRQSSAA